VHDREILPFPSYGVTRLQPSSFQVADRNEMLAVAELMESLRAPT
jgi:hypothetical protein